jgi:FtsH-binding integral membrane protein
MAGPRRRPLAWALTLGLVGCALSGWLAWNVRAWSPLAMPPYFALLGAVLGLAVRARQSVPQTAGLAAALTGALVFPTIWAVEWLANNVSASALDVLFSAGMGAGVFGLFGLAVGLSMHFERKRLEREAE